MKWISLLPLLIPLTACMSNNTDPLEPHQIVESPPARSVHWCEEQPVDVTEEKVITNHTCPRRYAD